MLVLPPDDMKQVTTVGGNDGTGVCATRDMDVENNASITRQSRSSDNSRHTLVAHDGRCQIVVIFCLRLDSNSATENAAKACYEPNFTS